MPVTNWPWRLIGMLIGLILLAAVPALLMRGCDDRRNKDAQSRVERGQTSALSNSAADAIGTVARSGARESASEDLTRSNTQEIRDAEGSNAAVNPAAHAAGLRALCRRQAYRDSEQCRLLKPDS